MWTISQGREVISVWGNSVSQRGEICLTPWERPRGIGAADLRCWESAPSLWRTGFLLFQDMLRCLDTMQLAMGWTEKWIKAGFKDMVPDLGGNPPPQFILVWRRQWEDRQGSEPRWRRAEGGSTGGRAGGISVGCVAVGGAWELLKAL